LPEEKERKTQNEMGKGGGKGDEAEESNNCRCSTLVNLVKSDTEPVTSVTHTVLLCREIISSNCETEENTKIWGCTPKLRD
jgi:hypothetical protein